MSELCRAQFYSVNSAIYNNTTSMLGALVVHLDSSGPTWAMIIHCLAYLALYSEPFGLFIYSGVPQAAKFYGGPGKADRGITNKC